MKIISITGAHSGIGKTAFAAGLLNSLNGWSALKVTVARKGKCYRHTPCGVCNEQGSLYSIVSDKKSILVPGKDTQRLKLSGAKKVLWLKAKPKGLRPGLKQALLQLRGAKGLIVEGNSALKYLTPDKVIYLKDSHRAIKASASNAQRKADIIIDLDKLKVSYA